MFAIISTGGKQYKVSENTMLSVSKIDGKDGDKITIDDVLFACDKEQFSVGSPQISGAKVNAEIVKQDRDRKILVFKKKRRKGYKVKNGHRQALTEIIIEKVSEKAVKAKPAKKSTEDKSSKTKKAAPKAKSKK